MQHIVTYATAIYP